MTTLTLNSMERDIKDKDGMRLINSHGRKMRMRLSQRVQEEAEIGTWTVNLLCRLRCIMSTNCFYNLLILKQLQGGGSMTEIIPCYIRENGMKEAKNMIHLLARGQKRLE